MIPRTSCGVTAGLATIALVTRALGAQAPADRVVLAGTVYDSVARAPLVGADVQFVRVDTAGAPMPRAVFARSDSAGRFRADSVTAGTWLAGFFHPMLDSLGIEPPLRRVTVAAGRPLHVDLGIPGPATLARSVCGAAAGDSTALVLGFVRDAASGAPRADATVRVTWSDLVIDRAGVRREPQHLDAHALPNGWYAACGVPAGASVGVRATATADSSGAQDMEVAGRRVVRRDLWLGAAAGAGAVVRGVVRSGAGRAIAGARVDIAGAADTAVTGDDGTFALAHAPAGSQTLEVRAVGYVPVRTALDVRGDAAATRTEVTLVGLRAFLDTVRVRARPVYNADHNGFALRRRTLGVGKFLDHDDIMRHAPTVLTDALRMVPGVEVQHDFDGEHVKVRDFGSLCSPSIYLDGAPIAYPGLPDSMAGDIANLVPPEEIDAVEVYRSGAFAPPQFSPSMSGCGSIVIWTRPPLPGRPRAPKEPAPTKAPKDTTDAKGTKRTTPD